MFYKDFGSVAVRISGPHDDAKVEVIGPRAFTDQVDWERVYDTARLFASHTDSPYMAVALAIQQRFAAWEGTQDVLARLGRA